MERIDDSRVPPVEQLNDRLRAYLDALPSWLREVLSRRNGGRVTGIEVEVPTPLGTNEVEEVTQLFCVANSPRHAVTEASSLREALVAQGLDPRFFPFAETMMNALLLTDGGGAIYVMADETGADELTPFEGGDELVAALGRAANT